MSNNKNPINDFYLPDLVNKNSLIDSNLAFSELATSSRYSLHTTNSKKTKMSNHDSRAGNHSHSKLSKYHYHLKIDKVYGDKKLKLCGQCTMPSNLSRDLKQLGKLAKSGSEDDILTTEKNSYLASVMKPNNDFTESKIDFKVLDLTAERQSGFSLPIIFLPVDLFNFKQLRRLHLDCNQIRNIPDMLGENLTNLEILTISSNCLQYLPDSLVNLKKLVSLHLSNNEFKYFPSIVCKIENLKFLDLSSNELEDLSQDIGMLRNLETLLLFQNRLRKLPDSIGKLSRLTTLWLGNNKLTALPRQITQMNSLEWDDQSFNLSTNIEGNPLVDPPYDVCAKGITAIREYYQPKKIKNKNQQK